jgi:diphthine-ammonia ligase
MCGIIGVFGREDASLLVRQGLTTLKNRGKDGSKTWSEGNCSIGHCLHSIVGFLKQPLIEGKAIFAANCEIYNWQGLNEKYNLSARNDAETLFKLLEEKGVSPKTLEELDGVYAFAFLTDNKLYLARDILGVKPLWFSHAGGFSFASEKKALEKLGMLDIGELNPRKILVYSLKEDRLEFLERPFFTTEPELKDPEPQIAAKLSALIQDAVSKRIPDQKFGLLFSGGIDSTLLAYLLKKSGRDFTCYTTIVDDPSLKEPEDLSYAKKIAKQLGLNHKIIRLKESHIKKQLRTIVPLIEDSNVVKVEVALTFFAACEAAKKDGCKVIFSGLGSEELFAGYQRHKTSADINKECLSGLLKLYERDLYRDDVITMYNSLEARLPFLDKELVSYSLRIPPQLKIKNEVEKYILRKAAARLGLPEEFTLRKKRAAQYGSNVSKALAKLTRKFGLKLKSQYLKQFYPAKNLRLAALISSGKDSLYALYTMLRQNYSVECLITLKSSNPDSFMFHTPAIELVELQSASMGIPLITQDTEGEKEAELKDLRIALKKAKEQYQIEGVITGALYSNYQRDRIEKLCDSLSLKIFSPLWHINQETEVRELLGSGFRFILTKIAAEGLNKGWLNTEFTEDHLKRLIELNKTIGLNIAGEGGEYESLVLDCPLFKKRIRIKDSRIAEESLNTATLIIKKAELEDKTEKEQ